MRVGLETVWQMDRGGCSQREIPSILQRKSTRQLLRICKYPKAHSTAMNQGGTADIVIRPWQRTRCSSAGAFCILRLLLAGRHQKGAENENFITAMAMLNLLLMLLSKATKNHKI